jgi:hypothetical protein
MIVELQLLIDPGKLSPQFLRGNKEGFAGNSEKLGGAL